MSEVEFGTALNNHEKSLFRFAMKLTKDDDEAKDLLQETLMKAYVNRDKFRDGTNLNAWLFTIMKNSFITNYQKMVRQKTFVDTSEDLYRLNNPASTTLNGGVLNMTMQELHGRIDALEDKFKKPFVMYSRGFKYIEIAERLNIPLGTVKNRIHVARQFLQSFVLKHYGGYPRLN